MKKAILFDLDGTLWDSSEQVVTSWNHVLAGLTDVNRQITLKDMQGWMGLQMDEIGRRCFQGYPVTQARISEIMKACEIYENEYLREHGGNLFPDLEEVLADLSKDYFLAIVSNCQVGYIEAFLEHHHLGTYISDLESFGGTGLPKGENIRLVCQRNHLDPAVYVGDIQGDYNSACMAGIPFIHAAYGFGTIDTPVPAIHSLKELRSVAEQVLQK